MSDPQAWPELLGVRPGATVLLMADVTRMAWRARLAKRSFTPEELLDAFLSAVGPAGTVLVPTYNFDLRDGERYDPRRTPPITGALGVGALAHPAFRRSKHPLHSFAVAGGGADDCLACDDPSSFGPRSVFALLRERKALQVALDLSLNDAFTYVHHVEELESVPWRRWRPLRLLHTDANGRTNEVTYRRFAKRSGHTNELSTLEPMLEAGGALKRFDLMGTAAITVDLAQAHPIIACDIREEGGRHTHAFSLERWVRDVARVWIKRYEPSRSARTLEADAAAAR